MTDRLPFPFLSPKEVVAPAGLLARARTMPTPRVALVNAGAQIPLNGIREAAEAGLATPILIGNRDKIAAAADGIGWDISGVELHHAPREAAAPAAAALAAEGQADAIMKGQIHSNDFLKALLTRKAGLRVEGQQCGHVFYVTTPNSDRGLIITDAALNATPDIELRKSLLRNAVALSRKLGVDRPRAAVLSATETPIASVPSSMEAAEIADWAQSALPEADVSGPMALDLVFSEAAARAKHYDSPVAGDADILLVPEITSGNAIFKLMVLGMGCCAGGLVLGAKVPLLLTSRSQDAPARIASAALGAVAAQPG